MQVTSAVQLLKLPVLLEHFAEHQERDSALCFYDFLAMHYWEQEAPDGDADRDMQLPFKKSDGHTPQLQAAQVAVPIVSVRLPLLWGDRPAYSLTAQTALPETFKGALFKPPRV